VNRRLQDWLTMQAERRPGEVAAVYRNQAVTYQTVEQASNRLARALKAAGCERGDRVALLLRKSERALIAMFGALKADCIYVPIDTNSPAARIERILNVCECHAVLAETSTVPLIRDLIRRGNLETPIRAGWMDAGAGSGPGGEIPAVFHWEDVQQFPAGPVESKNTDQDPAHILFTSGSTGMPKGVVITHANVIRFVEWAVPYFGMGPSDRVSGHPPLHFDLSTFDIYGAVAAGAQIHLVPPEVSLLPHRIAEFIRAAELTQWFSAPSALLPLAKFDAVRENDFPSLRRLLWCGEKFPAPALIYWMRRLPHVTFVNLYGPTEATIASSYYRVPGPPQDETADIPIGRPCGGETLMVLDEQLRPVPPGAVGDLYIGGAGLSPGYWRDPEKTRQVFLPNPFSSGDVDRSSGGSDRIYKTGDLARIGEDGNIYLVGRADSQIKLRGYRIELGEIESAVHAVPGIQDAAVVAVDSSDVEGKAICCAYVGLPGSGLTAMALKRHLSEALPGYMMPTRWLALDQMPHNANGKTDRVLLKQYFAEHLSENVSEGSAAGLGTTGDRIVAAAADTGGGRTFAEAPQGGHPIPTLEADS
jgi:amino acid adenylation domain-containing protein